MSLYRCTNDVCKTKEFESEEAVCAACGKPCLELVAIHYDLPDPRREGRTLHEAACKPGRKLVNEASTNVPQAVSCLRCKEILGL